MKNEIDLYKYLNYPMEISELILEQVNNINNLLDLLNKKNIVEYLFTTKEILIE